MIKLKIIFEAMETHGPWKTLKVETVHDTPWIKIDHCKVINPGGHNGEYSTIHFKNLAIGIVPLDQEGYVYLVGQYRYPLKSYSWEIPEGGGELHIEPTETAKRELREETGIEANKWEELFHTHLSNSASDEKGIVFLARELSFFDPHPEEDEEIAIKRVKLNDFFQMVDNGEITDSLSMMAAYKLKNMQLENKI